MKYAVYCKFFKNHVPKSHKKHNFSLSGIQFYSYSVPKTRKQVAMYPSSIKCPHQFGSSAEHIVIIYALENSYRLMMAAGVSSGCFLDWKPCCGDMMGTCHWENTHRPELVGYECAFFFVISVWTTLLPMQCRIFAWTHHYFLKCNCDNSRCFQTSTCTRHNP